MRTTFLGTGTSHGVPEIGFRCAVCTSTNPKDQRLRSSILIEQGPGRLLIDASSDFRQQALRHDIDDLTDILITHTHADHILGLDDTRIYSRRSKRPITLYLDKKSDQRIRHLLDYAYDDSVQRGGGLPKFENRIIEAGRPFTLWDLNISAIDLFHGKLPILGYRINDLAYLTDCSSIPEHSYQYLEDLDVLVLDALRAKPHTTHFCLEEAIGEARRIGARQTYFIHMAHALDHDQTNLHLPPTVRLAYDGLVLGSV
ncbi:MAG: MBL fold metallo-hydrolase [Planctomycetes bacterium]|nr:MBL fold metallo-hydrolase [Planctomycetota bacterium]